MFKAKPAERAPRRGVGAADSDRGTGADGGAA
jgi:hypothetical protein